MAPSEERPEQTETSENPEDTEALELCDLLVKIGEDFDEADSTFRDFHVRELTKNNLFWDGAQRLFWAEFENTWIDAAGLVTPSEKAKYQFEGQADRVVNIYRPHGESIIAAMSAGTPITQFFPEDADNPNDVTTAKAYSKIAKLLHKHNRAQLLFIKALFIFYNQGLVAGYNYTHEDSKYGEYERQEIQKRPVVEEVDDPITGETELIETIIPQIVGTTKHPKVRECQEVYGPLHVRIPSWCRKQEDIPVLTFEFEQHVSTIRAAYQDKFDKIRPNTGNKNNPDERSGRIPNHSNDTNDLCTVTTRWFRPSAYAQLTDKEEFEKLLKKWPNGVKVVTLDDQVLEYIPENLDDHWTITFPILSETIHQKPQGSGVVTIQEIRNDVITNADETIRQAIPETFADPKVLDFDLYQNTPRRPGQLFKATAQSGKSLSDGFYAYKPASLSQELDVFVRRLDSDAQFVSGAFPSIFGGQSLSGSKTAAEYAQSRTQALQRLSTYWKMMSDFWAQFTGRTVTAHARNLVELNYSERFVDKAGSSFINIFIERAELEGKVGRVEPESSENFPISSAQKRDLLIQMLQLKNQVIERLFYHPSNSQIILDAIGMPELHLPGAGDRVKQLEEIGQLIKEASPDGQMPSIPTEPDVDDAQVHIQVCRAWLISEIGQHIKQTRQDGYLNVLNHLKMHLMDLQMKTQTPSGETLAGEPPATNATGNV